MKYKFLILILLISAFGFYLRLIDYDRLPPFGETRDEFMYPFAGLSFIKEGWPTSWADFGSYPTRTPVEYWGVNFNLVSPWNEKPPLYPLLVGSWSILNGAKKFADIRLSVIRQIPVFLNIFSIIFIGLLAKEIFNKKTGLIAALFYATIPTIVMANRLSLIENLLIPLSLFTLWAFYKYKEKPVMPYLVGLGCGLTLLTKQTGFALPLSIVFILFYEKRWKNIFIITLISAAFGLVHPVMGYIFDWKLYLNLNTEYYNAMKLGIPETIVSIFRYPVIGHKEAIFLDSSMLLGWILLLSSPFMSFWSESANWRRSDRIQSEIIKQTRSYRSDNNQTSRMTFSPIFIYPYLFILQLCFVVGGQTWFGWHWFPVYPFLAIIIAKAAVHLYEQPDIFKLIFFYIILAASSLRFVMLITDHLNWDWPKILIMIFGGVFLSWQIPGSKIKKSVLVMLFLFYILINIYTVLNLKLIYPSMPQPLN